MKNKNLQFLLLLVIPFQLFAQLNLKVVDFQEVKSWEIDERYVSPNGKVLMKSDYHGVEKNNFQSLYDLDQIDDWPIEGLPGTAPRSGCSYDLTGNGVDELIFGSGYYINVYDIEGEPLEGWPNVLDHVIAGSPAIGNVDDDPEPEIIVTSSNYGSYGEVYAYNIDGSLLPGFPIVFDEGAPQHEPLLENIDSDPEYEILINRRSWPYGFVEAYNGDGSMDPYWENVMLDYIPGCSLSSGDVNGDGVPEIIACSFWALYVFDIKANILEGFPFVFEQEVRSVSYSNPILADIDEDGLNEIAVATCNMQPQTDAGAVYVLNGDGTLVEGWPQYVMRWIYSPVSVADIDNDGHLDVVVGDQSLSDIPDNFISAWNANGEFLEGFPVGNREAMFAQACIADIDGDNDLEVIFDNNVYGLEFQIIHHNGEDFETFEIEPGFSIMMTSPILKDINNDGFLNFMTACNDMNDEESNQNIYDVAIPYQPENIPLGIFLYNNRNTGEYGMDQIVGTQKINYQAMDVQISPNPFLDNINFSGLDFSNVNVEFNLFNSLGNLVYSNEIFCAEGSFQVRIDKKLEAGIYLYTIRRGNNIISGKISH
jgi:hypothetical protein